VSKSVHFFKNMVFQEILLLRMGQNKSASLLFWFLEKGVKKLKRGFLISLILTVTFAAAHTTIAQDKIRQIYDKIVEKSKANTPQAYTVTVENERFSEAMKELPQDILTGKGKPAVVIRFKKGEGFRVVIENIKQEYESLFSMYEDYFRFSGISKVQNPEEFKEIIDKGMVEYYGEKGEYVIVQAWDPEKEIKDDTYALFYLDKKNWVISKALYFLDGVPYVEAENSYREIGKYYMPFKIVLNYLNEGTSDVFLFKDYRFK